MSIMDELAEEGEALLKEGFTMALASGFIGDDADFFAKGFMLGHICAQRNTANPAFKKTIALWEDLKGAMKKDGFL